jgi:4-hydroxybenzoate polyprenyltransferase
MTGARAIIGERVKGFFGLSRMTHSVLDIAHPAVGAILVLGSLPTPRIALIGLLAAFSGFTAVFGLNDVMDCGVDCEKMSKYNKGKECFDIDSLGFRHPLAVGKLPFTAALSWVIFWGVSALVLAFLLNPWCAALMGAAVGLEIGYCRLLRITHWKALLSGLMVSVGGLAGVYAVSAAPPLPFILLFMGWAFAWEVGCRNIPNDWSDLEEDTHMRIRTVPVRFGRAVSSRISLALLCLTVLCSLLFPLTAAMRHPLIYLAGALAIGVVLLVIPALRWVRRQSTEAALHFFNRACFYPLAVFAAAAILAVV